MTINSPKQDPRVERTDMRIQEAFIDLVLEKGYTSISVREIAERAGIGFKTFYRHLNNKEQILTEIIDQLASELGGYLKEISRADGQGAVTLFTFVSTHQKHYLMLVDETILGLSVKALKPHVERRFRRLSADLGLTATINEDLLLEHWIWATLVFIRWWLVHHMEMPVHEIAEAYTKLVVRPFLP